MKQSIVKGLVQTVSGQIEPTKLGVVDAHNHLWIEPPGSSDPRLPTLTEFSEIAAELGDYRESGGNTIVDCQPGGCGRDGRVLRQLSEISGVKIVASTGFHLRRYYPASSTFFDTDPDQARKYFIQELTTGLTETRGERVPVRAGLIKIACEASLDASPRGLIRSAVQASLATGAPIQVHTEKGADAERIAAFMISSGIAPGKLILCHMDKRPDLELHRDLSQEGIALEYDTFYREKYEPEQNVWPLLHQMISAGLEDQVILATDMADPYMWRYLGAGPGLIGLTRTIIPRLEKAGYPSETVRKITGENIAFRMCQNKLGLGGLT